MRRRASKPTTATPALSRLGLATPPPFVGRVEELASLGRALREDSLLVVHGAVGSGKTRLARELGRRPEVLGSRSVAYVPCRTGDRSVAIRARAERALDILPGSLADTLRADERLLVIDDIHHLPEDDVSRLLGDLVCGESRGRVLVLTRDVLPLRRDRRRFEMTLDGLDESAARELWTHHEETYGPTAAAACDEAILRTRGMPLALRREYARAAFGADAWKLDKLPKTVRRALEAVAVIRIPVAPAAVAALVPSVKKPEPALIDLVSRQLIDPLDSGRFSIHDVVRDDVLDSMATEARATLERTAASLVSTIGRGRANARRMAWDAGDDGALGMVDPVDRMREAVLHLLAAGDVKGAAERLVEDRGIATRRGGGGEILALIESIERVDAGAAGPLQTVRAEIAHRQGRVAEALEICFGAGGVADALGPVTAAELMFQSGEVEASSARLTGLLDHEEAEVRCSAAAALAEIELRRGAWDRAQTLATDAFHNDRAELCEDTRARLHLALAAVEFHAGRITAARAALSRAASSGRIDPALAALIEARRATCLAVEGRVSEAEEALGEAVQAAGEVEAVVVADEIRRAAAMVAARRGDTITASETLRSLVSRRRRRGDEVGALSAEIDLVHVLTVRGEIAAASELASACRASAERRGLSGMAALAALAGASIDLAELRLDAARAELARLVGEVTADAQTRLQASVLLMQVDAHADEGGGLATPTLTGDEVRDDIDAGRVRAALALAIGESSTALDAARKVAVQAERAGRRADLAEALAMTARLQLARGDRSSATSSATRAAREALACGLTRARVGALLVLAALARDEGEVSSAAAYAQDVQRLATEAGLPVERLVAGEALDAIAGVASDEHARNAAAATMSQPALEAAARLLSDLGLTAVRPYRVITGRGQESFVSDANPDLLRMADRSLAIDGVREVIIRDGEQSADLRRRSLLKRLLFLFAGAPGRVFSKEEIVEMVWDVEYHPLRHDAALFTNIMRIRRLLGKDGAELIRVSEDGYRFDPPKDFLYVESVQPDAQ